ncbi:MAG TPA: GEVED domain-containing protein, partial [Thermoanaerobaculia bacterium]|nr:GEVED domain-containing protein [Thermoanaerobaculia bacterium]
LNSIKGFVETLLDGALDDFTVLYYTGNEVNGSESNDQRIGLSDFSFCAFDFGDAPDSYGTSLAADGARHVLGERRIWLGANRPDGESDGAPAVFGLNATGDDDARIGAVVDEDGVDLFPPCPQSGTYAVSVTASNLTSNLAYLVGYIDWDRDGRFTETGDRSATVPVPAGTTSGTFPVTWESVPVDCGGTEPTYARFRISSNQSAVLSPTGMAPDGEVEDYRIGAGTLPVTVARVESERVGREVVVRWTTASETSNAGFRLWSAEGEEAGELLGSVPSRKSDSFAPQAYEARLPAGKAEAFLIEDVSVLGRSRVHGPFAVGLAYGVEIEPQPNPWPALREELARNVAMESGPVAPSFSLNRYPPARIEVRAAGIQRIAYEDLAAAGVDLVGVPASRLALLDRGEAIARYVHAPDGLFGPGAWIEFYLEPELTLASPLDVVVLTVDAARALEPAPLAAPGGAAPAVLPAELEVASERLYSFSSPTADPWFEAQVLAWGRAARYEREFDLPGLADGEATLRVRGWGYGTFGESEPDHHVQVELNGSVVGEARFGGITPFEIEVDATGLLAETGNRVTVVVPGDVPYPFDNIAYDGLSVVYPRWSSAVDERFAGDARQVQWLAIDGF